EISPDAMSVLSTGRGRQRQHEGKGKEQRGKEKCGKAALNHGVHPLPTPSDSNRCALNLPPPGRHLPSPRSRFPNGVPRSPPDFRKGLPDLAGIVAARDGAPRARLARPPAPRRTVPRAPPPPPPR